MRTWRRAIVPLVTVGVVLAVGGLLGVNYWNAPPDSVDDQGQMPDTEQTPAGPRHLVLRPPRNALPLLPVTRPDKSLKTRGYAYAFRFRSEIYAAPAKKPKVAGYTRRGTHLRIGDRVHGAGCKGGKWYKVSGGGYICSNQGYVVADTRAEAKISPPIRQRPARLTTVLPYRYAKVTKDGAPRLYRLPTAKEERLMAQAAQGKTKWPEVVDKAMKGIFLVALDRLEGRTKRYYRTIRGRYVRKDYLTPKKTPPMHGELLGGKKQLPLAFVFGEDSPLFRKQGARMVKVGVARKHARFEAERTFKWHDTGYVEGPDELVVPRDNVRLVRRIDRPDRIPANVRWIHVDLSEQSLVAYEGDRPVFATLVSSGKKGFEPPIGVFRIASKHVSITMDGPDPDAGWYEVEEVPWTMYYWESFALHGAYWHNDFGKVRSHGCTNLAPADARWLFSWTSPTLDEGWHGKLGTGTYVTYTN